MEPDELLSLMTIGAVAPYALEAALHWTRCALKSAIGANAPAWFRLQKNCTRSA